MEYSKLNLDAKKDKSESTILYNACVKDVYLINNIHFF